MNGRGGVNVCWGGGESGLEACAGRVHGVCGACAGRVRGVCGACAGRALEVGVGGVRGACVGRAWGVRVWQLVFVSLPSLYYPNTLVNPDACHVLMCYPYYLLLRQNK